jgi:hypothetical protein
MMLTLWARQTAELFGVRWGGGLYVNYVFTAIWAADVAWVWWDEAGYRKRAKWVSAAVHGFLAFMFFNGAVVWRGCDRGSRRAVETLYLTTLPKTLPPPSFPLQVPA